MKLQEIYRLLNLFLVLYKSGKSDVKSLKINTNDNYHKLNRLLKLWKGEDMVVKDTLDKIVMGESRHFYEVSKKGEQIIRDIVEKLIDALIIKKENNIEFLKKLSKKIQEIDS